MPATNATGDERKYWGVIPMMSAPVLSDMTKRMEDIGFEGVTALQIYGPPWPSLSVAATATSRLKVATGIAVAAARSPFETAMIAMRSEEHTSELQSLMRISYAVFCLQKQKQYIKQSRRMYK